MRSVDTDALNVNDDFIITPDLSRPELYERTGKNQLDRLIDDKITVTMYSIGLEDYLIKIGKFKASEYKKHIEDYHKKYNNNELSYSPYLYERAYHYIKDELDKNGIFYIDDDGIIFCIDSTSTTSAICNIIFNSMDTIDRKKYKNLVDFVNYMISKEEKVMVLGGKK